MGQYSACSLPRAPARTAACSRRKLPQKVCSVSIGRSFGSGYQQQYGERNRGKQQPQWYSNRFKGGGKKQGKQNPFASSQYRGNYRDQRKYPPWYSGGHGWYHGSNWHGKNKNKTNKNANKNNPHVVVQENSWGWLIQSIQEASDGLWSRNSVAAPSPPPIVSFLHHQSHRGGLSAQSPAFFILASSKSSWFTSWKPGSFTNESPIGSPR